MERRELLTSLEVTRKYLKIQKDLLDLEEKKDKILEEKKKMEEENPHLFSIFGQVQAACPSQIEKKRIQKEQKKLREAQEKEKKKPGEEGEPMKN